MPERGARCHKWRMLRRRFTAVAFIALLGACARDPQAAGPAPAAAGPAPVPSSVDAVASAAAAHAVTSESSAPRPAATRGALPDFASLVERYGRAVVNVEVVGTSSPEESNGGGSLEDFLRQFRGAPGRGDDAPVMHGMGSGFIVSADGYILTNAHVVEHADEVTVRLTDRREFPAKVIGSDARSDVAVLKIDARDLPVVKLGDRHDVKPGEWVLAIGSPFGLENTATAGIVSGTSRAVASDTAVPFIQTDVAVNPGNSGGPLFDLDGEVVGMNSAIFSDSGGYMGISFAIPIDLAMDVRDQLVKTGHVVRGRIGVGAQDVDAGLASSFGLDRPRGALVSVVEKGGPAEKAGVKPGDVILSASGKPIEHSADLSNLVTRLKPGTPTELGVWRGGKARTITVRVDQLTEPQKQVADTKPRADEAEEGRRLGLVVRPLTPAEKQSVGTKGTLVVEEAAGNAARAGVQRGDIVLAVNSKPVRTMDELRSAAGKLHGGESAALLVERGGAQVYVPVRVPAGLG